MLASRPSHCNRVSDRGEFDMARTVCCGATPGLLPLESALRKLPGIIAHLGFIPKSCQYVLLSRDGEKCAGEGFEPDRGVARRDPHEPIARGALRGNQSRAFAPPQGAPPPPTAAHDAAMSPPTTRGRYCLGDISASVQQWGKAWTSRLCHVRYAGAPLALPPPWGFNSPYTKNFDRTQTTGPIKIFGAGRAFLPLSKIVTERVGRRPPQTLRDARREGV